MFTILVENQFFKIRWTNKNKNWYINKGYIFTRIWDTITVKAEDLLDTSSEKVKVYCDYCGEIIEKPYYVYIKNLNEYPNKISCKKCRGKKISEINKEKRYIYYNKYVEMCNQNEYKPLSSIDDYENHSSILYAECPKHGIFKTSYEYLMYGHKCPECAKDTIKNKNTFSKDEVTQLIESNGNEWLNKNDYIDIKTKNLKVKCASCGNIWTTSLSCYKMLKHQCPLCAKNKSVENKKLSKDHVEEIINSVNGNILLNPDDYVNNWTKNLNVKCGKCGNIFVVSLGNYKKNSDKTCRVCQIEKLRNARKMDSKEVINKIESLNNNKLLNPQDYINNSTNNLKIQCGECGETYTTSLALYLRGKIRCRKCSRKASSGERIIADFLSYNDLEYQTEKKFTDCRDQLPLPFDFYLPINNCCIEFDGIQHFEPVFGQDSFEKTQLHDQIKNDYCKHNNIQLIRIPYWEGSHIEEILTKELHI